MLEARGEGRGRAQLSEVDAGLTLVFFHLSVTVTLMYTSHSEIFSVIPGRFAHTSPTFTCGGGRGAYDDAKRGLR